MRKAYSKQDNGKSITGTRLTGTEVTALFTTQSHRPAPPGSLDKILVHRTDKHFTLAPDQLEFKKGINEHKVHLLQLDDVLGKLGTIGQLRLRELQHHRVVQHQLLQPGHILRQGGRGEDCLKFEIGNSKYLRSQMLYLVDGIVRLRICRRSDSKQKEKIRSASSFISMAKEVARFRC